jgi:hypothetical protein
MSGHDKENWVDAVTEKFSALRKSGLWNCRKCRARYLQLEQDNARLKKDEQKLTLLIQNGVEYIDLEKSWRLQRETLSKVVEALHLIGNQILEVINCRETEAQSASQEEP